MRRLATVLGGVAVVLWVASPASAFAHDKVSNPFRPLLRRHAPELIDAGEDVGDIGAARSDGPPPRRAFVGDDAVRPERRQFGPGHD